MSTEVLWFVSRASGLVSVVLLTGVVVLGTVVAGRRTDDPSRRAVLMGLHRSLALGMLVFLVLHIVSAVTDGYVDIGWAAVVLPFVSGYEPLWIGLGAVAFDLLVAVIVTSVLRQRIPERVWRTVHWLTYAMWPIALLHGFQMGTADQPLLLAVTPTCTAAGLLAVLWRSVRPGGAPDHRRRHAVRTQEWA